MKLPHALVQSALAFDPFRDFLELLILPTGANGSTVFTDYSPRGRTVTRSGTTVSTADLICGGPAASFTATSANYLQVAYDSNINLATADFTLDFFYRPTSVAAARVIYENRANAAQARGLVITQPSGDTAKIRFAAGDTGSTAYEVNILSTISLTANAWNHVAAQRRGSEFSLWMGGVKDGTATWSGIININSSAPRFGCDRSAATGTAVDGKLALMRLIVGAARYTSNFVPPTLPYPIK